jgi:sulfite reductase beta subunit-like hemoprotein
MGLSATRDIAGELVNQIGAHGKTLTWALSGCGNSCTQPQLADAGIVTCGLTKDEQGDRTPRFDLYRRIDGGLGSAVEKGLTLDELCSKVREIG